MANASGGPSSAAILCVYSVLCCALQGDEDGQLARCHGSDLRAALLRDGVSIVLVLLPYHPFSGRVASRLISYTSMLLNAVAL